MLSPALFVSSLAVLAAGPQGGLALLRSDPVEAPAPRVRPLPSAAGSVGWIRHAGDALRVEPRDGSAFEIPLFRDVRASADGRTVVAWGDPTAPEHPFALHLEVYREGRRVPLVEEAFGMGSALTVATDGRVGIVGYRGDDRSRWEALWSTRDGRLARRILPAGLQAKDPALSGDALLVRVHGLRAEGIDGAVLRVETDGAREILAVPRALELVSLPGSGRALVRTAESLTLFEAADGRVLWTRAHALRPIGPHAWTEWTAESVLAVLVGDVQRAAAPAPPVRLLLLDAEDGALAHALDVERRIPLPEARLLGDAKDLVLEWRGVRETYGFTP